MRLISITAAALALSTSVALAQTATPGGSPTAPGGGMAGPAMNAAPAPHVPAINPLTTEDVSHITGTTVYGSDAKRIGAVSHVLIKPDSKTVDRLVVSEGGLLGIGARDVALPLDQFVWDPEKEGFTIAKTADQLKTMPEWQDPAREAMASPGAATPATH